MVKTLKKVSKELVKASKMHKRQSVKIKKYINKTNKSSARRTSKKGQLMARNQARNKKKKATEKKEQATAVILGELGLREPHEIPDAEEYIPKKHKVNTKTTTDDPAKMFTITGTASGLAITGDDKHNAIYLPKVAVPEIIKALVDFI